MPAIEIKDLVKIYQGKTPKKALNGINLSIPKGSFFGLLGPNGAGKSTTIEILAGLTIKTSGKVRICSIDIDENPIESRYKIGVVPQEIALDSFFNTREVLEYYAGYYSVKNPKAKINELLERLDLADKASTMTYALSGGMKRRLLVAKALIHNPDVVILDEPTAGVDIELRQNLWNYVKEMNSNYGTTIIITTHYLEEAQQLCDRLAIINKGNIVANDTTKKLISEHTYRKYKVKLASTQQIPASIANYHVEMHEDTITITVPSDVSEIEVLYAIFTGFSDIKEYQAVAPSVEDVFKKFTN